MKTNTIYVILFVLIVVLSALIYIWYTGGSPWIATSSLKPAISAMYGESLMPRRKKSRSKVQFSETVLERKIDETGSISDRPIELHVSAR